MRAQGAVRGECRGGVKVRNEEEVERCVRERRWWLE